MRTRILLLTAIGAGAVLLGASLVTASAATQYGTLRALANHLRETARGALDGAADEARRGASSSEEDRFLSSIRSVARGADDFNRMVARAAAAPVNPQQIGPIVDRLLEEARQADRRMRDARVFTSIWDDSGRTITILRRMASLVRS